MSKKSYTNFTKFGNRPAVEFFNESRPSWKTSGEGHQLVCFTADGPGGVSISTREYSKETDRFRQTITGLTPEQVKHLHTFLGKVIAEESPEEGLSIGTRVKVYAFPQDQSLPFGEAVLIAPLPEYQAVERNGVKYECWSYRLGGNPSVDRGYVSTRDIIKD